MTNKRTSISTEKNQAEFDWALGLNRYSLRLMGIWPDEEVEDEESLTVLLRVPFMILSLVVFLILPQTYALVLVIHELPLVVENLMTSWASYVSCVKLFFMWRSKKLLQPVIKSVTQDWLRTKSDWELQAMKRQAYRARIFSIWGYLTVSVGYCGLAIAPFFRIQLRTITNITDHGDRFMSVQSAYPYDYTKSPTFDITQMSQLFAGIFLAMSLSIPDNYFGALVFHSCAQFEILGDKIQHFQKDASQSNFYKKFRAVCDRHVHLLLIVSTLEEYFCFIIGSQVLSALVMMVCLGFQVQDIINNTFDKTSLLRLITIGAGLMTILLHTFVDCFASETLITYNVGIFHAVYNTKWYFVQNRCVRDLIPMMVVARKTIPLTAGKMFYLTLESYCSLLKTSVGYISILIAVNGR